MAYHIYIVFPMLVSGWATSTLGAPPTPTPTPSGLTLETCGVSQPCGPLDSYTTPCPASRTCNEYYNCDKGTKSIQTCDKAFYMFWMTPVFDTTNNCCKLVFSFGSPGQCSGEVTPVAPPAAPAAAAAATLSPTLVEEAPEQSKDDDETNAHVKRHAEPGQMAPPADQAVPPQLKPSSEGNTTAAAAAAAAAAVEAGSNVEPQVEEPAEPTEQLPLQEQTKSEKFQQETDKKVANSACVVTAPFLAVVIAIFSNVLIRRSMQ